MIIKDRIGRIAPDKPRYTSKQLLLGFNPIGNLEPVSFSTALS